IKAKVIITFTQEEIVGFESGRVQELLPKYFKPDFDYYLCGFTDFIESVESELRKVGAQNIFFEKWG
ncbi:hypothetical protein KY329_04470, partial [Candidatus Woesearchaeota archaeon]|nr:hypothetical protein [Candidatus Woesearchaeota archaeon]